MQGLSRGIYADLIHQEVRFISKSGSFLHINSKDLAQLSKIFLHICDSILQLSGLSVLVFQAAPQHATSLTTRDPGLDPITESQRPEMCWGTHIFNLQEFFLVWVFLFIVSVLVSFIW